MSKRKKNQKNKYSGHSAKQSICTEGVRLMQNAMSTENQFLSAFTNGDILSNLSTMVSLPNKKITFEQKDEVKDATGKETTTTTKLICEDASNSRVSNTTPVPQTTYNNFARNSQNNINSSKCNATININPKIAPCIFDEMKEKIIHEILDAGEQKKIMDEIEKMKTYANQEDKGGLIASYQSLISTLADHATLIAAIAPLVKNMFL